MSFTVLSWTCGVFVAISFLCALIRTCCAKRNTTTHFVTTIGALLFLYYATSISMSMLQKYLLTMFADGEFKFPLTMTCIHMATKTLMCSAFLGFPCCKRSSPSLLGTSTSNYLLYIVPIGLTTAADIGLSNISLLTTTITLYVIGKTSSILFNYTLSVTLKLQPATCVLTFVVVGIFSGMVMASYHATDFDTLGFVAVVLAAASAASRWVITERYFEKHQRKLRSIDVLYLVSPISIPVLIPFALLLELGPIRDSHVWHDTSLATEGVVAVVVAGITSFLLIFLELAIVSRTSALTTDVLGYVKNISLVVLAGLTYGDALSPMNVIGVCIAFSGAVAYSALKARSVNRKDGASSEQVAYEILSVLELAETWSDEDSDGDGDGGSDSDGGGVRRLDVEAGDTDGDVHDSDPSAPSSTRRTRTTKGGRRSGRRQQRRSHRKPPRYRDGDLSGGSDGGGSLDGGLGLVDEFTFLDNNSESPSPVPGGRRDMSRIPISDDFSD